MSTNSTGNQTSTGSSGGLDEFFRSQAGIPDKAPVGVSPDAAAQIIENRPVDGTNVYVPRASTSVKALAAQASNTVQSPASIAELVRALKNDVDLIYRHVYENVDYVPLYGLSKGSLGALQDGMGSAFDQANLLYDMLVAAGYTCSMVFGQIEITQNQAAAWLGSDPASINNALNVINNGGIPWTVVGTFPNQSIQMPHVWVQCTISGTVYIFDPSFKSYSNKAAINLGTALNYNQATLLSQAQAGATIDASGNWIQNVNKANIDSTLATYSTNLINWIKTNNPTAEMDDIVGGRAIVPLAGPVRQTSLPYQKPGDTPVLWTAVPNTYKSTLRIQYPGIDVTFYSPDIYGKRLTLFFNASNQAELRLDGTLVATGTAQTPGTWNSVLFSTVHPYATTAYNQFRYQAIYAPATAGNVYYLIGTAFGPTGKGMIDFHQKALKKNRFLNANKYAEEVMGERLAVQWATYQTEFSRVQDVLGRMANCYSSFHHSVGLAYWSSYVSPDGVAGFDISSTRFATTSLDGNATSYNTFATAIATYGYALEMLAIQQTSKPGAVAANRILELANTAGARIYKGTQANWNSVVVPALTGYNSTDLNNILTGYLNNGWNCLIPQSTGQSLGSYLNGYGWALITNGGALGNIGPDGTKGGTGGTPGIPTPEKDPEKDPCEGGDPVQLTSGAYVYRQTDIEVGSGDYPYKLGFEANYSSENRYLDGPLGLGWAHTWQIAATVSSDGLRGLGLDSPIEAAASIASMYLSLDLLADTTFPILKEMTMSLAQSWWCEQLTQNTVTVSFPHKALRFAKLPDGSYNPELGDYSVLTKPAGLFKHTSKHGVVSNFDSSGNLVTQVYPYGVTVTLTYSAGVLQTVSNGLGRTLTLNYTGNRLTSVSDGTGRSAGYSVDANSQLTAITDPLSNQVTFQYDSPGRLWKHFAPENPLVPRVTNTFDTLDRVKSQLDVNGKTLTYYLAGWRSEMVDQLGFSRVAIYNSKGARVQDIDELGFVSTYTFDGLLRLTRKTFPEGNYTAVTYDSKNNMLTETKVAKAGSGLANIQRVYTYDPLWNLVKTEQDGLGRITTFNYNATTGNLESVVYPTVGGQVPQRLYTYNARGQVLTVTDETGIVTKNSYSPTNETLTQVIVDFGAGRLNLTTNYGYNAQGDNTTVQDPRGNTWTSVFDAKRRKTQVTDPAPFNYVTKMTWNKNDRLTKIERQTGIVATPWQTVTVDYNVADQPITGTDPLNRTQTIQYDDRQLVWKRTDEENRTTTFTYDGRKKLATVTDPAGVLSNTQTYTPNGNLASSKDERNNITIYTFDGFDRPDKVIFPSGASDFEQNQIYDANGNLLRKRVRSGETIDMVYDELNRVTSRGPTVPTTGFPTETYVYDLASRLLTLSTPVVAGDPATGVHTRFYDTAGRFFREQYPDGKQVTSQLDANGNVTKLTYPDSYFVDRVYDQLNRLTDIKLNGAAASAAQFQYDDLSRRKKLTFNNSTTVDYTYFLNNDLNTILQTFVGASATFTYGYNNAHQMTSQQVSDSLFMWHASPAGTVNYQAANALDQYPKVGTPNYSYNANGCLSGNGTWTYTYTPENIMLTAVRSGTSVTFRNDPYGRQAQKEVVTTSTTKTRYIYSGWQRIADYNGTTGALQNRYVYGVGLDEPLIQVASGGGRTYMYANHQGTIVARANASGAVSNRYKIGPFGETPSLSGTTFGYNGQRWNSEMGLYYYKRRFYNPTIGRFLQPDPIYTLPMGAKANNCACCESCGGGSSLSAFPHLYRYVDNDPLNNTDPYGEFTQVVVGAELIALVGLLALLALLDALRKLQEQMKTPGRCPWKFELPPITIPTSIPFIPTPGFTPVSIPTAIPPSIPVSRDPDDLISRMGTRKKDPIERQRKTARNNVRTYTRLHDIPIADQKQMWDIANSYTDPVGRLAEWFDQNRERFPQKLQGDDAISE
jgi:RHS repeat-associated protein